MMSSFAFADVWPGPNGQYCTITHVNFNDNAWNSTIDHTMLAAKATVGKDLLGNTGGIPITIQFSKNCDSFDITAYEIDSTGKPIGKFN